MRLLDRYILSRFLTNFFSSFVILMFIFIFQTIWLFIDDLAGKGLDIVIIGKFLFYLMPNLTEKVLPLTVLLSSILTFGSFAENYEFAAMKASGISLQRAMKSLIIFVILLCGVTFYFANSVIPASEQKIYNMRRNIAKVKPAAAIEEGVFSEFEGMSIKVAEKYGENDSFLRDVIIHQKTPTNINNTVIIAKGGKLLSSEGSEVIQLVLNDGHYFEDIETKKSADKRKYPFAKANFDIYRINIEIPELEQNIEEVGDVSTYKMKNVFRLTKDIDSLKKDNIRIVEAFSKNIINRSGGFKAIPADDAQSAQKKSLKKSIGASKSAPPKVADPPTEKKVQPKKAQRKKTEPEKAQRKKVAPTEKKSEQVLTEQVAKLGSDLVTERQNAYADSGEVLDLFENWQRLQIMNSAKTSISNIMTTIVGKKDELQKRYKIHNLHILSFHKKFALALSCIILFFVGAPLGAIIRKGGVGLPMVIAIILFLVYYFVGVFSENYAKEGNIHPILGAWVSTLIMLPLGIYLTRRATADKGGMNFASFVARCKSLFTKKNRTKTDSEYIKQLEIFYKDSRPISNDEHEILLKSLVLISEFPQSLNINNSQEFIKIHERNLKQLILLNRSDASDIINDRLVQYPKISEEEIKYYLEKKQRKITMLELLAGRFTFLIRLMQTKGNSLPRIEAKLKEIASLNTSLAQLISKK